MSESCDTCAFAFMQSNVQEQDTVKAVPQLGCRRYPPQVSMLAGQHPITHQPVIMAQTAFPTVQSDSWCGEYEEALPAIKQ